MISEYGTFNVAQEYVTAIEYGDYSGLEFDDETALEGWYESLPDGIKTWDWTADSAFCRDDVTGLMADCVEATLYLENDHEN
jgi:hypothetical protein